MPGQYSKILVLKIQNKEQLIPLWGGAGSGLHSEDEGRGGSVVPPLLGCLRTPLATPHRRWRRTSGQRGRGGALAHAEHPGVPGEQGGNGERDSLCPRFATFLCGPSPTPLCSWFPHLLISVDAHSFQEPVVRHHFTCAFHQQVHSLRPQGKGLRSTSLPRLFCICLYKNTRLLPSGGVFQLRWSQCPGGAGMAYVGS